MLELTLIVSLLFSSLLHVEATRDKPEDIKDEVAEQIYSVSGERSRGTGFVVQGESGKKYIATNAHVCDQPSPIMYGRNGLGEVVKLKIVREYYNHDLCLLSPARANVELPDPIPLADGVRANEQLYIVGHPLMDVMTVTTGKAGMYHRIVFPIGVPLEACNKPKYFVDSMETRDREGNLGIEPVCIIDVVTLGTTVPTDGGASGSPLLNEDAEVVGVVMATAGNISWAEAVPLDHLKKFLKMN